ncbi:MAG: DUF4214 domain-containing protein, partial [Actinomycetota bacterium]|nr:DUF4214 domain-containing protein [Actinomycetota bacterium]
SYTPPCYSNAYDSYVRGIQFAPDGSYFVVVATGGYYGGSFSACDAAARWETSSTGINVAPTWIDQTGTDSLYSVAVTGTAIYVGGHQRWQNNPYGQDTPGTGAVPRPGLAALDPVNGEPLAWNPGRNPRGHGAETLLATPTGLWVGSDTDYIGDHLYFRQKIAVFPLAGGASLPAADAVTLPARIYTAGPLSPPDTPDPDAIVSRTYDGSTLGATSPLTGTGIAWSQVRGAFMTGTTLWYGWSDGTLHKRSFDGTTFGPDVVVDPYNDPTWSDVATGSGGSYPTYRGTQSDFSPMITSLTGAFFSGGRLYYTLAGDAVLHSRAFTPDSGIIGAPAAAADSTIDWSDTSGMFLAGGNLYFATRTDGDLHRVSFAGGHPTGSPAVVSGPTIDGNSWRNRSAFALSAPSSPAQRYIQAAYVDFLGRASSSDELAFWQAALSGGTTRLQFVRGLANSTEWLTRVVRQLYTDTLGRPGDSNGIAFWVGQIQRGHETVATTSGKLYASNEYFTHTGASDLSTWVRTLYAKILHRTTDTSGVAYWVHRAQTNGRDDVAYAFYQSPESRLDRVTVLYVQLLGRAPDAGGGSFWSLRILAAGDVALAANLASSDEYYRRSQTRFS